MLYIGIHTNLILLEYNVGSIVAGEKWNRTNFPRPRTTGIGC